MEIFLKAVELTVDTKVFKHHKMFGTLVKQVNGVFRDPCAGDSGLKTFKIRADQLFFNLLQH